jgi:hypothetical protein
VAKVKIVTPTSTEEMPEHEFNDDFRLIVTESGGKSKVVRLSGLSDDDLLLALREARII